MDKLIFETSTNSYEAREILGEGGSGTVYSVFDGTNDFAIKRLDPEKATKGKLKRFENELRFSSRNNHKNIITVIDHGTTIVGEKKAPFFVMPLYRETLRKLMDRGISHDQVLPYFSQILDGVEAAHLKGIWHRDLKPENVLFDPSSATFVIADFGIAQFGEDELHTLVETRPHDRLANFQYSAPEQRARSGKVDHRADIFALGLILNEIFTKELLQGSGHKTIASVAPNLAYLDAITDLMIRQTPSDRPNSIEAVKNELKRKGNEFISSQRISQLTRIVVPESEDDDPLILNPVRLVNVDYNGNTLFLELSPPINRNWMQSFGSIGSYQSLLGKGPPNFGWDRSNAVIEATEREAPVIVEHFKRYVEQANSAYVELVKRTKREKKERQRKNIQEQLENERKRQRVLQNIKL